MATYFKTTSISDLKHKFVLVDKNINEIDLAELKKKEFIKGLYKHFRDEHAKVEQTDKIDNKLSVNSNSNSNNYMDVEKN